MQEEFSSGESPGLLTAEAPPYGYAESVPTARSRRSARVPATFPRYWLVKRVLDIAVVLALAPLLIPLLMAVALAVRFTSPGPIFYSHRRIRQHGAFFSMWKFRTMCVNSAEVLEDHLRKHPKARSEWSRCHKLRRDPRITPVGSFLRRYSLDELPQIWNVILGQMSLVGPRPIVAAEVQRYKDAFSSYCRVKPGLTGLWQVSGRCTLTYDERVELDRRYVETWSLHGDLKILIRTFPSVVNQDGAY